MHFVYRKRCNCNDKSVGQMSEESRVKQFGSKKPSGRYPKIRKDNFNFPSSNENGVFHLRVSERSASQRRHKQLPRKSPAAWRKRPSVRWMSHGLMPWSKRKPKKRRRPNFSDNCVFEIGIFTHQKKKVRLYNMSIPMFTARSLLLPGIHSWSSEEVSNTYWYMQYIQIYTV